ncbi:MAG: cupin domain-containing protein, partial [Pseudomonadota bacterium]
MPDQVMTFRELLAPISPEDFFKDYFGKQILHLEGPADRYSDIFSWQEMNNLLRMSTIWSSKTLELSADGHPFPAERYCYEGVSRDNEKIMRPDFDRVKQHLRNGASLTLNFMGRLSPGLRSLSQTFEAVFCGPVNITAFCSWDAVAAYPSHFDTTSVFVCQIDGEKTWNIYDGRMLNAAQVPGQRTSDYPDEYHEKAKGSLQHQLVLKPGDILYLPNGQYHDAVASSNASLHISLAVRHYTGYDFISLLTGHLPKDPLFREQLPPLDHVLGPTDYRKRLSGRLNEILSTQQIAQELRQFLHSKAFEGIVEFDLPNRGDFRHFRVRWMSYRLEEKEGRPHLTGPSGPRELTQDGAKMVQWALDRDYFSNVVFVEAFQDLEPSLLSETL